MDVSSPVVRGDSLRFSQILNNLISNAMKFTKKGDSITVSLREVESGNHARYLLVVEDTGIGMSEEFLPRLFEPYGICRCRRWMAVKRPARSGGCIARMQKGFLLLRLQQMLLQKILLRPLRRGWMPTFPSPLMPICCFQRRRNLFQRGVSKAILTFIKSLFFVNNKEDIDISCKKWR